MKLRILSDIHNEFTEFDPPKVDCDAVILAGDIHVGSKAIPWIEKHFQGMTVIYVPGNHEGYHHDFMDVYRELNDYADSPGRVVDLRFLNKDWTQLFEQDGGHGLKSVWVFGGTLWTDFRLMGTRERCMQTAHYRMNDYRTIKYRGVKITPEWTALEHAETRKQLAAGLLGIDPAAKKIVVTHHLPSAHSIDNGYRDSDVNAAYASELSSIMEQSNAPALWVHGHTHRSKDYRLGNTRVVCNPRGYVPYEVNPGFIPDLVVDV